jgi:hypothetical protein
MPPDEIIALAYAEYYLTLRPVYVVFDGQAWSVTTEQTDSPMVTLAPLGVAP